MQTQNGIELDLNKSKFISEYKDYCFYFSSKLYLEKFEKNIKKGLSYSKMLRYIIQVKQITCN